MRRRLLALVAAAVAVAALAGCDIRTLGAPTGSTRLTATFDDVQHLVPGHAVKLNDVQVGTVTKVSLDGYRARVTMSIVDGRHIPVGATATLSQTSLLGESYVRIDVPDGASLATGPYLASGADISATSVEPSLEQITGRALDVLGAVDGGDLAKIVDTLATGLGGRGDELHAMIDQLGQAGKVFADQSSALGQAIDDVGRLGTTLAAKPDTFGTLLDDLDGATRTLADQRQRFVASLADLQALAATLDGKVLDPHGEELRTILVQLDDVAATLAADRDTVGRLLTNLATLTTRAQHSADNRGGILIYGWVTAIALPGGGQTVPLPSGTTTAATTGSAAVVAADSPPGAGS